MFLFLYILYTIVIYYNKNISMTSTNHFNQRNSLLYNINGIDFECVMNMTHSAFSHSPPFYMLYKIKTYNNTKYIPGFFYIMMRFK